MSQLSVDGVREALAIDCQKEEDRIVEFIQNSIKRLHKDGAVIGLSGGLDSSICAYLLKKALGKGKVLAVLLPERDSSATNHEHAHLVAKTLGLKTVEFDLSPVLEQMGVYAIGKKPLQDEAQEAAYAKKIQADIERYYGGYFYHDLLSACYGSETTGMWKLYYGLMKKSVNDEFAFQFSKVRLRMVFLYFHANQRNYAVIGTTDKSEYSTAIYCNYGDGANDIQILRHLYKTQLRQLARHLQVPDAIIDKPNSGDLYGNLPHAVSLGMSYETLDTLLLAIENGLPSEMLNQIVPEKGVQSVMQLRRVAELVRQMPFALDGSAPTAGKV